MPNRRLLILLPALLLSGAGAADEDPRAVVALPAPMHAHMLANMREHLETLNNILARLAAGELDAAAALAEEGLGMTAMERHGGPRMAPYMPEGMRRAGAAMHHAASRFALTAEEGDASAALAALAEVTAACVACHAGYRVTVAPGAAGH